MKDFYTKTQAVAARELFIFGGGAYFYWGGLNLSPLSPPQAKIMRLHRK